MKPVAIVGIVLIVIGIIGFAYGGLGWTTEKKDAHLGLLKLVARRVMESPFPRSPAEFVSLAELCW